MRAYGLPRNDDVANPDKADIAFFGLKGSRLRSDPKKRTRRIWKKRARRLLREETDETFS